MESRRPSKAELGEFLAGRVTAEAAGEIEAFVLGDALALDELGRLAGADEFSASFGPLVAESGLPSEAAADLAMVIGKLKAGDLSPLNLVEQARRVLDEPIGEDCPGRLGKFEIVEVLAAGGMGLVFRANDPDLQREVAIKTLSARLAADAEARELFLREARAVALLDHPNILPIHAVEEGDHVPFIVMPLLGWTLADLIARENRLPPARAARLVAQAADALAAAHAKGIVHRDIKPSNLLLDGAGSRVFVSDFGIARRVGAGEESGGGAGLGTPAFAAPEQIAGGEATPRSDLYALGATLHFALSGSPPGGSQKLGGGKRLMRLVADLLQPEAAARPDSAQVVARRIRQAVRNRVLRSLGMLGGAAGVLLAGLLIAASTTSLGITGWVNRWLGSISGDVFFIDGRLGTFASLGEAAAGSQGREVIIDFDGERPIEPVRYGMPEPLTIRACGGRQPILLQADVSTPMLLSGASVTLEGLTLVRPQTTVPRPKPLITMLGGSLSMRHCAAVVLGDGWNSLPLIRSQGAGESIDLSGCLIYCPRSPWLYLQRSPVIGAAPQRVEVAVEDCFIAGMTLAVLGHPQLTLDLDLEKATLFGNRLLDLGAEHRVEIDSSACVIGMKNTLIWMRKAQGGEARHFIKWRAGRNAYALPPEFGFMRWGATASAMPYDTPEEWRGSGLFDVEEIEPTTIAVTEGAASCDTLDALRQLLDQWGEANRESLRANQERGVDLHQLSHDRLGRGRGGWADRRPPLQKKVNKLGKDLSSAGFYPHGLDLRTRSGIRAAHSMPLHEGRWFLRVPETLPGNRQVGSVVFLPADSAVWRRSR